MKITKRKIVSIYPGYPPLNPVHCYSCGYNVFYLNAEQYLFNNKIFCSMNCVEDYIKHFYEYAALTFPWVLDEIVFKRYININKVVYT